MARSSPTKASVDLAASAARVAPVAYASRIRRDPPPPVKVVTTAEIKDREALTVVVGIVAVALALLVILVGVSTATWAPSQYTIRLHDKD